MAGKSLRLGFDVTMENGAAWRPLMVNFWNQKKDSIKFTSAQPFKYMGDALTGLSLIKLNQFVKSPLSHPNIDYNFVSDAWNALEPHVYLYGRSQDRIRSLQAQVTPAKEKACNNFETQFNEILEGAMTPWGVDMNSLGPLLEAYSNLEKQLDALILFNFGLNFSKSFIDKLHTFYSFLFHLRSIVAIDHNSQIGDAANEALKIDSVLDYFPRTDYVTNDALLYWNFKKLSAPFSNPRSPDTRVDKLFASPLEKAFQKYSNNACTLINNLPLSFMNSMNPLELEEALYLVQMDWLLGSPAGLLFKIREEVYGLQFGYEKVFWKDFEIKQDYKAKELKFCCDIKRELIYGKNVA